MMGAKYLAAAAVAIFAGLHSAAAGSFTLIEGKRYGLCRSYEKNLAAFPDLSETTEEWPLDPRIVGFSKPHWHLTDVARHKDLLSKLYLWANRPLGLSHRFSQEREMESDAVPAGIANGSMRFEEARVDFDNDGHIDTVYRLYHPVPAYLQGVETKLLNGYWYIYADQHGANESFRRYSGRDRLYDSFLFKGRFYLIAWEGDLTILEPHISSSSVGILLTPVCRFSYAQ